MARVLNSALDRRAAALGSGTALGDICGVSTPTTTVTRCGAVVLGWCYGGARVVLGWC